jgi:hypothetical protein
MLEGGRSASDIDDQTLVVGNQELRSSTLNGTAWSTESPTNMPSAIVLPVPPRKILQFTSEDTTMALRMTSKMVIRRVRVVL